MAASSGLLAGSGPHYGRGQNWGWIPNSERSLSIHSFSHSSTLAVLSLVCRSYWAGLGGVAETRGAEESSATLPMAVGKLSLVIKAEARPQQAPLLLSRVLVSFLWL